MIRPLLLVSLSFATFVSYAQPSTGGPAPQPSSPNAVPFDGGASLLLASGVAYGLRRLHQHRSSRKSSLASLPVA